VTPSILAVLEIKKLLRLVLTCLVAVPTPTLSARSGTQPVSFECRSDDRGNYAIVLRRNGEASQPIIAWTTHDTPDYTTAHHCQIATDRLNALLQNNDRVLEGLYLTVGRVNNQSVICTVEATDLGCNEGNILFPLAGANARDPNQTLEDLSNCSTTRVGSSIQDFDRQVYVYINCPIENVLN
jgi:Circadian oscillating protein COP23